MSSPFTQEKIMSHRFTAPFCAVLVLALAAFTGSALAGDHHGGGSGDSGKAAKQDKASKQDKQSSTSASQPATGGDNSQGVKPSDTTKHDTYAKASSDQTKKYGNGQTAGQIATKSGHGDATLHGPGNSQPHKTAACPGGHEVDVHALKHKDSKCGSAQETKQVKAAKVEGKQSDVEHAKVDEEQAESADVEKSENDVEHAKVDEEKAESADVEKSENDVEHAKVDEEKAESADVEKSENEVQSQGVAGVQATQTQNCGTTTQTVTEQVLVGVKHMIGPKGSGRFVLIHPSTNSAHFTGKHEDDIPVYETVTKTITVPVTNCPATPAATETPAAPATVAPATAQSTAAGAVAPATATAAAPVTPATATPASAGGVKGATVALKPTKTKPASGVLGATTRLGGKVAATRLPFTGLPLWIFALVAAGLIGIGITVRRASAHRI
jgi:hypothetical protein